MPINNAGQYNAGRNSAKETAEGHIAHSQIERNSVMIKERRFKKSAVSK